MRYAVFNNTKVVTSTPVIVKGKTYVPVLINGNWQDIRENKVSFDAKKLSDLG
jgi:hypothetical protein